MGDSGGMVTGLGRDGQGTEKPGGTEAHSESSSVCLVLKHITLEVN